MKVLLISGIIIFFFLYVMLFSYSTVEDWDGTRYVIHPKLLILAPICSTLSYIGCQIVAILYGGSVAFVIIYSIIFVLLLLVIPIGQVVTAFVCTKNKEKEDNLWK